MLRGPLDAGIFLELGLLSLYFCGPRQSRSGGGVGGGGIVGVGSLSSSSSASFPGFAPALCALPPPPLDHDGARGLLRGQGDDDDAGGFAVLARLAARRAPPPALRDERSVRRRQAPRLDAPQRAQQRHQLREG